MNFVQSAGIGGALSGLVQQLDQAQQYQHQLDGQFQQFIQQNPNMSPEDAAQIFGKSNPGWRAGKGIGPRIVTTPGTPGTTAVPADIPPNAVQPGDQGTGLPPAGSPPAQVPAPPQQSLLFNAAPAMTPKQDPLQIPGAQPTGQVGPVANPVDALMASAPSFQPGKVGPIPVEKPTRKQELLANNPSTTPQQPQPIPPNNVPSVGSLGAGAAMQYANAPDATRTGTPATPATPATSTPMDFKRLFENGATFKDVAGPSQMEDIWRMRTAPAMIRATAMAGHYKDAEDNAAATDFAKLQNTYPSAGPDSILKMVQRLHPTATTFMGDVTQQLQGAPQSGAVPGQFNPQTGGVVPNDQGQPSPTTPDLGQTAGQQNLDIKKNHLDVLNDEISARTGLINKEGSWYDAVTGAKVDEEQARASLDLAGIDLDKANAAFRTAVTQPTVDNLNAGANLKKVQADLLPGVDHSLEQYRNTLARVASQNSDIDNGKLILDQKKLAELQGKDRLDYIATLQRGRDAIGPQIDNLQKQLDATDDDGAKKAISGRIKALSATEKAYSDAQYALTSNGGPTGGTPLAPMPVTPAGSALPPGIHVPAGLGALPNPNQVQSGQTFKATNGRTFIIH